MHRILYNIDRIIHPSPEDKAAFENIIRQRTLQKNEYFLREGEVCQKIAFIEKGSVRLYYDVEGKEICKDFLFENALIGSFASFLSQMPSGVNIAAMEETLLLELEYQDVMHLFATYSSWQKLGHIIVQDQFVRAECREASLLKDPPEVRYKNLIEEHPKVFKRVPLQYIASYLSITPETLSRYRSKSKR
ncbi:Crp/Fnr family transcriptional regulator [Adhaeribacter radiodurans]|uniref:Crp/Fnr family transcriptional regulator n=1 Tax=Adhaeribacter radiodurans TaxID=2745197 RepID=A0A7L7L5Q5_9BACT|nr:Crp/Fnr family transcriptional regulator [Adhaeribacter radiodurans]QMU28138.1 Crp/Fnr family transcriptional regulator [Adhaeribacter radiodurans]